MGREGFRHFHEGWYKTGSMEKLAINGCQDFREVTHRGVYHCASRALEVMSLVPCM